MNNINKILIVAVAAIACVGVANARPHGGGPRMGFHGGPPPPHHHHHHHSSFWGRGGRHFWPGFVGGVVGGLVTDVVVGPSYYRSPTIVTTPTVVTPAPVVVQQPVVVQPTPTYVTQNVWVEGRYVDQVQANGTVIRVWQPGHYEQRQVLAQ